VIVGLVGERGGEYLMVVYGTLAVLWLGMGLLLNRFVKGESPEILLEIPSYHLPPISPLAKKLWVRMSAFLKDAVPFMLLGIILMNVFFATGLVDLASKVFSPVLTRMMGLPETVVVALMMGFLRKDVAVGMLAPLELTAKQLVIASTVLAIYFPCIAAFIVLLKELGVKDMAKSAGIMLALAIIVGSLLNLVWRV
jgi:ferrous iron transport protein B